MWIDIPAHRILAVPRSEIRERYKAVNSNGDPLGPGEEPYRVIRNDGAVFKPTDFVPMAWAVSDACYLREI